MHLRAPTGTVVLVACLAGLSEGIPHQHKSAAQLQGAFNDLISGAELIHKEFRSEAAAVNQARTAYQICPQCSYTGPKLDFFSEMVSVDHLVDRRYIVDQIFPALAKARPNPAHLWIGVRPYSMRYEYIFRADGASRVDTIEPDTAQALYGSSGNHYIDIAQNIDQHVEADTYDIVTVNGVLGWGINSLEEKIEFYFRTARVMKPGGILLIGYNPHIGDNHTAGISEHFQPTRLGSLPQKMQFDIEWKHTYEFYEKKEEENFSHSTHRN